MDEITKFVGAMTITLAISACVILQLHIFYEGVKVFVALYRSRWFILPALVSLTLVLAFIILTTIALTK